MLLLLAALSAAAPPAGRADELMLGYSPASGVVTGYFSSSTGDRFSCIFAFRGRVKGELAEVVSHFPGNADPPIAGLLATVPGGATLELQEEHGGCANVQPFTRGAVRFGPFTGSAWIAVRVAAKDRVVLRAQPGAEAEKPYVVKGDPLGVLAVEGEWLKVEYTGATGKVTGGWVRLNEMFPLPG